MIPKRPAPFIFSLLLTLCTAILCSATELRTTPIPVVLDTDIGSDIDDTWALAYLLSCPELDLKMVMCGTADTHWRGKVAAKFLETCGRTDIPVALGPQGEAGGEYQGPWVKDYKLSNYSGEIIENGVEAFIDLVNQSSETITLIAIGPIPNVKEAIKRDPSIAQKIRFVGMFGSIDMGYSGGPAIPETNVRVDVEAFKLAHQSKWKHFEITPLDTCGLAMIGGQNYQNLLQSESPMIKALFENYQIWAKLVPWINVDFYDKHSSTLFDVVAVNMAFTHEYLEFETLPISVTDDGYTIRDQDGIPTLIAMKWKNLDAFYDHVTNRLLGYQIP